MGMESMIHRQFRDDPLNYPWGGIAVHGNTRFETTLVTEMEEGLYLGGCVTDVLLPEGVEYVVSLYPWEQYRQRRDQVKGILSIALYDDVDQDPDLFVTAADVVAGFLTKGPTLVHCQAGLNRSGTVMAIYLMRHRGMSADEALAWMRERRTPAVVCNTGFEAWLLAYDPEGGA